MLVAVHWQQVPTGLSIYISINHNLTLLNSVDSSTYNELVLNCSEKSTLKTVWSLACYKYMVLKWQISCPFLWGCLSLFLTQIQMNANRWVSCLMCIFLNTVWQGRYNGLMRRSQLWWDLKWVKKSWLNILWGASHYMERKEFIKDGEINGDHIRQIRLSERDQCVWWVVDYVIQMGCMWLTSCQFQNLGLTRSATLKVLMKQHALCSNMQFVIINV